MFSVLGVGGMLILSALRPAPASVPLAAGLVLMALLLFGRVAGATWENLHLLRQEAAEERRRQAEKLELMGRLAGGVAHIINNQMTVVLGYAELGREEIGQSRASRAGFEAIGAAAQGASALAERLLLASGRRLPTEHDLRPLGESVRAQRESRRAHAGPEREVIWEFAEAGGGARVGLPDLKAILRELLSNSVDATPPGGKITIRVREETLSAPPPDIVPAASPGPLFGPRGRGHRPGNRGRRSSAHLRRPSSRASRSTRAGASGFVSCTASRRAMAEVFSWTRRQRPAPASACICR